MKNKNYGFIFSNEINLRCGVPDFLYESSEWTVYWAFSIERKSGTSNSNTSCICKVTQTVALQERNFQIDIS